MLFLGPHPWHMEVPRLGSNWSHSPCRPTPQPQQHRIWAMSATCTIAHSNTRSLTHWARPGIEPVSSWILVRFVTLWATRGTLGISFLNKCSIEVFLWQDFFCWSCYFNIHSDCPSGSLFKRCAYLFLFLHIKSFRSIGRNQDSNSGVNFAVFLLTLNFSSSEFLIWL